MVLSQARRDCLSQEGLKTTSPTTGCGGSALFGHTKTLVSLRSPHITTDMDQKGGNTRAIET